MIFYIYIFKIKNVRIFQLMYIKLENLYKYNTTVADYAKLLS